jgi:hypothetical protein
MPFDPALAQYISNLPVMVCNSWTTTDLDMHVEFFPTAGLVHWREDELNILFEHAPFYRFGAVTRNDMFCARGEDNPLSEYLFGRVENVTFQQNRQDYGFGSSKMSIRGSFDVKFFDHDALKEMLGSVLPIPRFKYEPTVVSPVIKPKAPEELILLPDMFEDRIW